MKEPSDEMGAAENVMLTAKEETEENNNDNKELQFEAEIDIKTLDDSSDCKLYACALVSPNLIALADAGNKSVKVVDVKQREIIHKYRFNSEPCSVAVVKDNVLAITLPDEKKIVFLNFSENSQFIPAKEMKVSSECKGVVGNDENLLILYHDHVEILNVNGEMINEITHSTWDCLMGIALSHDSKTFYVTDSPLFGKAKVFKFDFDGNIIATYEDEGLLDVRGLSVSQDGTVLVCNYDDNGSIHVISPELKKIQEILKSDKNVRYPWCVSFSGENEQIFICNNELQLDLDLRNQLKIFHQR